MSAKFGEANFSGNHTIDGVLGSPVIRGHNGGIDKAAGDISYPSQVVYTYDAQGKLIAKHDSALLPLGAGNGHLTGSLETSSITFPAEVSSASDDRTANNGVRHQYRVLTDAEKQAMVDLKDMGAAFIAKVEMLGKSRENSLAITKIEEAVMWAVKGLTK